MGSLNRLNDYKSQAYTIKEKSHLYKKTNILKPKTYITIKSNMYIYLYGFSLTSRCTALFHSARTLRHLRPCGRQTPVEIRR